MADEQPTEAAGAASFRNSVNLVVEQEGKQPDNELTPKVVAATNIGSSMKLGVVKLEMRQPDEEPTQREEEEEELEEGELKDDDDDDDDDDDLPMMADPRMADPRIRGLLGSAAAASLGIGPRGSESINNLNSDFQANALADDHNATGQPKKKRKRVVRKVKRKIKVIKKVPKKKADEQQQQLVQASTHEATLSKPLLPQTVQRSAKNNGNNNQSQSTNMLSNNQQQPPKRLLPLPSDQHRTNISQSTGLAPVPTTTLAPSIAASSSTKNQSTNIDSLWEQQILMIQLQKQQQPQIQQQQQTQHNPIAQQDQHAQILRAAATDEDLRFLQPPLLFHQVPSTTSTTTASLLPHLNQSTLPGTTTTAPPFSSSSTPMGPASIMSMPNLLPMPTLQSQQNMITTTDTSKTSSHLSQIQSIQQPQLIQQSQIPPPQQTQHLMPQQTLPILQPQQQQQQQQQPQPHKTTPSSPDDEHGKSSYEAISKMLTMLRNSANISDSNSEMINEADPRLKGQQQKNLQQLAQQQQLNNSTDSDTSSTQHDFKQKYSLIPVQVDGIDYTKYKLYSQYEPKFKNDPRLNQQA